MTEAMLRAAAHLDASGYNNTADHIDGLVRVAQQVSPQQAASAWASYFQRNPQLINLILNWQAAQSKFGLPADPRQVTQQAQSATPVQQQGDVQAPVNQIQQQPQYDAQGLQPADQSREWHEWRYEQYKQELAELRGRFPDRNRFLPNETWEQYQARTRKITDELMRLEKQVRDRYRQDLWGKKPDSNWEQNLWKPK